MCIVCEIGNAINDIKLQFTFSCSLVILSRKCIVTLLVWFSTVTGTWKDTCQTVWQSIQQYADSVSLNLVKRIKTRISLKTYCLIMVQYADFITLGASMTALSTNHLD